MDFMQAQFDVHCNWPIDKIIGNIKTNLKHDIPRFKYKHAVMVAGGPSINDFVEDIRNSAGDVIALNGSAKWLRRHGIKPKYHILMDARSGVEDYIEGDPDVTYYICSQCDPKCFERAKGCKVIMWHAAGEDAIQHTLKGYEPGSSLITGGGTVGLRSLYLLFLNGYFSFTLYGYDSSNRGEEKHAFAQKMNEGQKVHEFRFNGKTYLASGPMAAQANEFVLHARKLLSYGCSIEVKGDGLLPDIWRNHCEMREFSVETREAEKYRQIWAIPGYRNHSPGELLVDEAMSHFQPKGKVIDFGCGSGRALKKFSELGYETLGVDITPTCIDAELNIPLCISPLWNMPDLEGDFGFCTDVLEHLPTEHLDESLFNIKKSVNRVYFQISTVPDKFGNAIGDILHLTVKPMDWWLDKLSHYWDVDVLNDYGTHFTCVAK